MTAQASQPNFEQLSSGFRRLRMLCCCLSLVPVLMTGCLVGPDYSRPALPALQKQFFAAQNLPASLRDQPGDLEVATTPIGEHDRWWEQLDDSRLILLIEHAVTNSMSLREAYYRVCEARARRDGVALAPWPQLGVSGGYRRRSSRSQISPANSGLAPTGSQPFDVFSAGANASWELDVWGRLRRSIEAENNRWIGSVDDARDVLVTLISDVAVNYVDLRVLQQRLKIARANVKLQQRSLDIATDRFDAGLVGALDVKQAESLLKSTSAGIPSLEEQIAIRMHRLAVLLGTVPSQDLRDWIGEGPVPVYPGVIAAGVPVELVQQRPDVRSAERAMRTASAEIGVAIGNLYPRLSLVGDLAWDATDISQVFNNQTFFSAGPSASWNLLTLGRTRRNIDARKAEFQQMVYRFREAVLTAIEEVENGLVGIRRAGERAAVLNEAATAAHDALNLSQQTYEIGEANFQRVLEAQRQLLQAQDSLLAAEGDVVRNFVLTYRALGGGWRTFEFVGPGCCADGIPCDQPMALRFLPLASLPPLDGKKSKAVAPDDAHANASVPPPRDADDSEEAWYRDAQNSETNIADYGDEGSPDETKPADRAIASDDGKTDQEEDWYAPEPVDSNNVKIGIPAALQPEGAADESPSAEIADDSDVFDPLAAFRDAPSVNEPITEDSPSPFKDSSVEDTTTKKDSSPMQIVPRRTSKRPVVEELPDSGAEFESEEAASAGSPSELAEPSDDIAEPLIEQPPTVDSSTPDAPAESPERLKSAKPEARKDEDKADRNEEEEASNRIFFLDGPSAKRSSEKGEFRHSSAVPLNMQRKSPHRYLKDQLSGFGYSRTPNLSVDNHAPATVVRRRRTVAKPAVSETENPFETGRKFGHSGPRRSSVPAQGISAPSSKRSKETANSSTHPLWQEKHEARKSSVANPFADLEDLTPPTPIKQANPDGISDYPSAGGTASSPPKRSGRKTNVYPPSADLEEALRPPFNIVPPGK